MQEAQGDCVDRWVLRHDTLWALQRLQAGQGARRLLDSRTESRQGGGQVQGWGAADDRGREAPGVAILHTTSHAPSFMVVLEDIRESILHRLSPRQPSPLSLQTLLPH